MPTALNHLSDETRDQLAELALKMSGSQKTRKGFLGLVKEVSPETPIPELDTQSAIDAALKTEREEREKQAREFSDYKLQNELAARKNSVKDRYGLDDDSLKKMEEMMGKKELPADYEWAAKLYQQQTESAAPTAASGYGPLFVDDGNKAFDGLMNDEVNWSKRTAHAMVDDMLKKGKQTTF